MESEERLHMIYLYLSQFITGTIRAIVSIRVLNKTSEEYWFLMNFNLSHVSGNADIRGVKIMAAYFLVRLRIDSRSVLLLSMFF